MYAARLALLIALVLVVQTQARAVRNSFKPDVVRRQAAVPTVTQAAPVECQSECTPFNQQNAFCGALPSSGDQPTAEQIACVCKQSFIGSLDTCSGCVAKVKDDPIAPIVGESLQQLVGYLTEYCAANAVTSSSSSRGTTITSSSRVTGPTGSTTTGAGRTVVTTTAAGGGGGGGGTTSGNNAATGAGERTSRLGWGAAVAGAVGGAMLVWV